MNGKQKTVEESEKTLEEICKSVLTIESAFCTPILTNVVSYKNKIFIKIENVTTLTSLAEKAKSDPLQQLTIRAINVEPVCVDGDHESSCRELTCVIKLFLNGVKNTESWGRYVSVASSFNYKTKPSEETQESAIVSWFVQSPRNKFQPHHSRHYRQCFRGEQSFVGLKQFISKESLKQFISDDESLGLALSVVLR